MYMYPFSPKLLSHPGCHITLSRIPCASRSLLVTHFKYSRVYESSLSTVQERLTLKCVYWETVHQKFYSWKSRFFLKIKTCLYWVTEKALATHSSTLAWKIPWMQEPGRLQSMGSQRVGHDWATSLSLSLSCIGEGNGNPLQCSCLENPRDRGAWWAAVYGVAQSRTRLKWVSSSSSYWVKM